MADLCEAANADVEVLAQGMGFDPRIGRTYLKPGPGFGGSCFPKDTRALKHIAARYEAPNHLIPAVIESNEKRKIHMAEKIIAAMDGKLKDKTIGVLGLTFKANTDDMRESASLVILPRLEKAGATLKLFDPQGAEQAQTMLKVSKNAQWCTSMEEALSGVDAAVILTEWQMFSTLDWKQIKKKMKRPLVIDLRNLFDRDLMAKQGITYHSVGRLVSSSPASSK